MFMACFVHEAFYIKKHINIMYLSRDKVQQFEHKPPLHQKTEFQSSFQENQTLIASADGVQILLLGSILCKSLFRYMC